MPSTQKDFFPKPTKAVTSRPRLAVEGRNPDPPDPPTKTSRLWLRYDSLRMTSYASPGSVQSRILRAYTALLQLRPDWGGALILSLGLAPDGAALAAAANIAGAVSLSIDDDSDRIREIVRTGAVDFVVHTLDEAIRAMKNEVRKRAPLSVALSADPLASLEEAAARGLAPQLFSSFLPLDPKISEIACRPAPSRPASAAANPSSLRSSRGAPGNSASAPSRAPRTSEPSIVVPSH